MKYYVFWVETETGERTEWRCLTARQALNMYSATDKRLPHNVVRYGWGEMQ